MDLNWTDYSVIVTMVVTITGLLLKFAWKKTASLEEYIWGGRDLGVWTIAGSLIATNVSGLSLFTAMEIYHFGVNIVFENVGILLMILVIRLQAAVLCKIKLPSLNEYFKLRFCRKVQILCSLVSSVSMIWSISIYGYSVSLFSIQIINAPLMTSGIVVLVSSYILSALSGFKGVAWTDAVQVVAIFFSQFALIAYGLNRINSFGDIFRLASEGGRFDIDWSLDPTHRLTFWSSLLAYGPHYILVMSLASPAMYQRYCALPDLKAVNKVAVIHVLGQVSSRIAFYTLGYVVYAVYAKCDPYLSGKVEKIDQIIPYFLQDIGKGKAFIHGIFITGYACASFSSLTSLINTLSINIYKDLLGDLVNPRNSFTKAKRYIQLAGLFVTLISILVLFFLQHVKASVIELTTYSVFFPALYVSVTMAGIFLPTVNSKGVFWGASVGFIFALINEIGRYSNQRLSPTKIMRIDGCYLNVTQLKPPIVSSDSDAFYVFRISNFCQFAMNCAIVTSVMLIASYFYGRGDCSYLDMKLISPLVRPNVPKTEASIPLSSKT